MLLAVTAQIAELVEFSINPALDYAAITQRNWRLRDNRFLDPPAHISKIIYGFMQPAPSFCRQSRKQIPNRRNLRQRCRQRQDIASIRSLQRHAAEQPLQIEDSTASSRKLISAASIDGRNSQERSKRLPIGVTVRSMQRNRVMPASDPANKGSMSSRLRTVTASSTRQFWRS